MKSTLKQQRKLSAIMFTDIQNFTEIMGNDEDQALKILERHKEIMLPNISDFEGIILKFMGDGILIEFNSGVEAVRCATKIQDMLRAYNRGMPVPQQISLRIGIHVGDVVVMENDIYGDGVNIASRLQSLANPGGICISQAVHDMIKNRSEIQTISLGKRKLKNIKEELSIYEVVIITEVDKHSVISNPPINYSEGSNNRTLSYQKNKWLLLAGLFSIIILFTYIFHNSFLSLEDPFDLQLIKGQIIRAYDKHENLIWQYDIGFEQQGSAKQLASIHYSIADINNDGMLESIIGLKPDIPDPNKQNILCLSARGEKLWEFRYGLELNYPSNQNYPNNYNINKIYSVDLLGDSDKEILISYSQTPWFPTFLEILNAKGESKGKWLNNGNISNLFIKDLDKDGSVEIVVGGTNNDFQKAFIAVLDPSYISGQGANIRTCNTCLPGTEKIYCLLPKPSFSESQGVMRPGIGNFEIHENNFVARVSDAWEVLLQRSQSATIAPYFIYFDFKMNLKHISKTDNAILALRKLAKEGVIPSADLQLDEILYWNGDSWSNSLVNNKHWINKQ